MRTVPLRNLGACLAPDNAWQLMQGIETLPLRMDRHCENSLAVAQHLQAHASVSWVRYPGLTDDPEYARNQQYLRGKGGAMVIFGIKGRQGSRPEIHRPPEALLPRRQRRRCQEPGHPQRHAPPTASSARKPQAAGGITPDLVRLSIGIENIVDILADLDQALTQS